MIVAKYIKQQLHIVYVYSNNFGHLITKNIITLQHFATLHQTSLKYTSLRLSTLHFLSFTLDATGLGACVHMPPPPKPVVNEISFPATYTDTDDYIVLYYIIYDFSDNFIQPDDGQIIKGRNM